MFKRFYLTFIQRLVLSIQIGADGCDHQN